jgi:uncharacterized protein
MNFKAALIVAALFAANTAIAQTPATTPAKPPVQQPATPAQPAHQPGQAATATRPPSSADAIDPAEETEIRHLMEITQTAKLGDNIRVYIENQLHSVMGRAISPEELPKFMDSFNAKLAAGAPTTAIVDAQVPIYAHAFSKEDIEGLITFYESPLGQRVIKALPQVSQQSEEAGMQIEQKAAMDALQSMTTDYPQLNQMMASPSNQPAQAAPAPAPAPSPEPKPSLAPPQK